MQAQLFEGYWENGGFVPSKQSIRKSGRLRAILTILDEPIQEEKKLPYDYNARIKWLDELEKVVQLSMDEELPEFQRSKVMRQLIDLKGE